MITSEDPHIVTKLREGREEDVRPCVGAGYCLDRIYVGKDALYCVSTTQPRAGRIEGSSIGWARGRKVVVVGGGVAGLEAARVCAERGHKVVLFEAGSQVGG